MLYNKDFKKKATVVQLGDKVMIILMNAQH